MSERDVALRRESVIELAVTVVKVEVDTIQLLLSQMIHERLEEMSKTIHLGLQRETHLSDEGGDVHVRVHLRRLPLRR